MALLIPHFDIYIIKCVLISRKRYPRNINIIFIEKNVKKLIIFAVLKKIIKKTFTN